MRAEAVIGANYGDEGKGLFTDFLCANRPNPVVIMTNGGSQRGHTVELEDGTRHVFHHFSSGTFRKAVTYFPKSYLLNPMQFVKEFYELKDLGHTPISYHDEDCIILLPCDIALNWHIEKARGEKKHGSVGCGIWETKYRVYNGDGCTLHEFNNKSYKDKLEYLHWQASKYCKLRCEEEKISRCADIYDLFMSKGFIDHFIADCEVMQNLCSARKLKSILDEDCTIVFENGQGLKLDLYYGAADEANTTPSFTGSIGIAKLINDYDLRLSDLTVNYISRTYITKHGAGRFVEAAVDRLPENAFIDETNVFNEWQEGLRFAKLDYDKLLKRCSCDFDMLKRVLLAKEVNLKKNIIMTHANELTVDEKFIKDISYVSNSKFSNDIMSI